jgi:hypothetical protein
MGRLSMPEAYYKILIKHPSLNPPQIVSSLFQLHLPPVDDLMAVPRNGELEEPSR